MGLFSMKLESLNKLFIHELKDLYDAEHQITSALPKMIEKCNVSELQEALQEHLDVTDEQIGRLERCFQLLNEKATRGNCRGMKGIIAEGSDLLSTGGEGAVLDAGIIASCQKVEHYEIAAYGAVRTYAELLGKHDIAQLLDQTLQEEKNADRALSAIARNVNIEAKAA